MEYKIIKKLGIDDIEESKPEILYLEEKNWRL